MKTTFISEKNTTNPLSLATHHYLTQLFPSSSQTTLYEVNDESLRPCIGCFSCWLKTPGTCAIKDLGQSISSHFILDDVVTLITPIYYGAYSSAIKRVLDRNIPNIMPFFRKFKGEIHHAQRYKKRATLFIIAYNEDLTSEEEANFLAITQANALNFDFPFYRVFICRTEEQIKEALTTVHTLISKEVLA